MPPSHWRCLSARLAARGKGVIHRTGGLRGRGEPFLCPMLRPLSLVAVLALLGACTDPAASDAPATGGDESAAATTASRTYDRDDADSFCDAIVTEDFVRRHFEIPVDVPLQQRGSRMSCSGHWGADDPYADETTHYSFTVVIDRDVDMAEARFANVRAERTAAENQASVSEALGGAAEEQGENAALAGGTVDGLAGAIGGTETEAVPDLGDEAAVVRVGGTSPAVAFRLANVRVQDLSVIANAWSQSDDYESHYGQIEERSLRFARALASRM